MHIFTLSSLILLLGITSARMHDYCACQYDSGKAVNPGATSSLASDCNSPYTFAQKNWEFWIGRSSGSGPRFQGAYLKSTTGRIDGAKFNDDCKRYDGWDSTCFDCKNLQWNPHGAILCRD
ncbi:hypothetical protein KVT40_002201 [Elsinoe batatas]|uniref:Cyanovirin-N domain-containing protein n=1 Tax=Elsinoe batatas TaxID=2601811 RepID=A0A8K0L7X7_9PEZI|nr:hypothetical protein KVT40_002201 [Elsinoe batatas]